MSLQRTISLERDWSLVKELCDTVEGRHPLTLIPWILYSPLTTGTCLAPVSSGELDELGAGAVQLAVQAGHGVRGNRLDLTLMMLGCLPTTGNDCLAGRWG